MPLRVLRGDGVSDLLAGPVLRLVGFHRDFQNFFHRRHGNVLRALNELFILYERDVEEEIGFEALLNGNVHGQRIAGGRVQRPGVNLLPLGGHQNLRPGRMGGDQHVRRITRLVGMLVRIDVNGAYHALFCNGAHVGNPQARGEGCFALIAVEAAGVNREPGHLGNGVGVVSHAMGIGGNTCLGKNFRRARSSPRTGGLQTSTERWRRRGWNRSPGCER